MNIIEKTLGNYYLPLNIYIKNNLLLTRSLVVKNEEEANVINDVVKTNFNIPIDDSDKTTWKYYLNLAGKYYMKNIVDMPIYIQSKDNFETIELTKENLNIHRVTRDELLKFDSYYLDLVNKYPLQEIYIRSVITNVNKTEEELVNLPNFTIISYNSDLIEEQEYYLIPELQIRLYNYSVTWLLNYYCISDSLYLAAQIAEMYNFLFKNILSLRLEKAKTNFAHTFFILTYLASHHNLDKVFYYLNRRQLLYLYRNLLYLQNHTGNNFVFKEIIDYIFTQRNISLVTYDYKMKDGLNEDNLINYSFKQRLLNNKNLPYNRNDFDLTAIKTKEVNLASSNEKEYKSNFDKIDFKLRNSLFNKLLTKDLESIVIDYSDNVRWKLIPTLIDNYAYLLKKNKLNYFVSFIIPTTNETKYFTTLDFFKLFIIILYYYNNERITTFPEITIQRVYKEDIIDYNTIKQFMYRSKYYYKNMYNDIVNNIPRYSTYVSPYMFENYIKEIYKFDIALWLYLVNLDDVNDNGQFEYIQKLLTKSDVLNLGNETVDDFLQRYGLSDVNNYNLDTLKIMLNDILDTIFNNKLKNLFNSYYIQKALIEVFKIFKSYTTQLIKEYYVKEFILTGVKDTRYAIKEDITSFIYFYDHLNLNAENRLNAKYKHTYTFNINTYSDYSYREHRQIDLSSNFNLDNRSIYKVNININTNVLGVNSNVNNATQEHLLFLSLNS